MWLDSLRPKHQELISAQAKNAITYKSSVQVERDLTVLKYLLVKTTKIAGKMGDADTFSIFFFIFILLSLLYFSPICLLSKFAVFYHDQFPFKSLCKTVAKNHYQLYHI